MVDYARLDEELAALAADLDIESVLASVPPFEGLDAVDAALETLGEDVPVPKAKSFKPPKMTAAEAEAEALAHGIKTPEETGAEPELGLSNFHAGLTPSDLKELAEIEAAEAAGGVVEDAARASNLPPSTPPPSTLEAQADSELESDGPPTSPSIPPLEDTSASPESAAPAPAAEAADVEEAAESSPPTSVPPSPIFKEEDLAAIRASSPPPAVDVDVEIADVEIADVDVATFEGTEADVTSIVEELEMDELDFVEFDDDELELEMGEPVETSRDAVGDAFDDVQEATVTDGTLEASADEEESEEGEKRGFFKKIFG